MDQNFKSELYLWYMMDQKGIHHDPNTQEIYRRTNQSIVYLIRTRSYQPKRNREYIRDWEDTFLQFTEADSRTSRNFHDRIQAQKQSPPERRDRRIYPCRI